MMMPSDAQKTSMREREIDRRGEGIGRADGRTGGWVTWILKNGLESVPARVVLVPVSAGGYTVVGRYHCFRLLYPAPEASARAHARTK